MNTANTLKTRESMLLYIRENYSFLRIGEEWVASCPYGEIRGVSREEVRLEARRQWCHFNFRAEAIAFNEIFG